MCHLFNIREFKPGDEQEIYILFRETVRAINSQDYSEEQIKLWAPDTVDMNEWKESFVNNYSFVAVKSDNNQIIGFVDLTVDGWLNRSYVHKDFQRKGI
jgi:putative acetyltransferase